MCGLDEGHAKVLLNPSSNMQIENGLKRRSLSIIYNFNLLYQKKGGVIDDPASLFDSL